MTFEYRLGEARRRVESDLAERMDRYDRIPGRLRAAITEALLGGGKRFRPFLVLESAALFGGADTVALTVASALEAVHCYSLVHDDLPAMDNDPMRRGRPTVWKAYDEWTAILAGDALLTMAFEWLAEVGDFVEPRYALRLSAELSKAAGPAGMVGGQAIDLEADKLGLPTNPTFGHVRRLQEMKTGALIRFACRAGPLLAGASDGDLEALSIYGDALGLAFQISDDLLDATGDAVEVGKAVAKDAALGKATFVSLHGLDGARRILADTQNRARSALAPFGDRSRVLLAAVEFMGERRS